MLSRDRASAHAILTSLQTEQSITAACIYDLLGSSLAVYKRPGSESPPPVRPARRADSGQMPELDGFECTRRIRLHEQTTEKHIPIIAMTANAMKKDPERCRAAGMDDYISKPVNPELLYSILESHVPRTPGEEAASTSRAGAQPARPADLV
jgi:DNA-binding NarL/FixJ family response regulator